MGASILIDMRREMAEEWDSALSCIIVCSMNAPAQPLHNPFNLQNWSQHCCLMPNKINSNGIHANVKLMPSLSIWLLPHPILSSLTPSIAPLPDPLSILCNSWLGNLTWASPSHPIIVTHSCSSAGTQSWRAAERFHCSTASSSMCLRADIPALRDSPRLTYIHDCFHMLLPRMEARGITGRLAGSLSSACWRWGMAYASWK